MTKEEFKNRVLVEKPKIGTYQIEVDYSTEASFILGCCYNGNNNIWEIYENDERGLKSIIYKDVDENIAYDKLYKLVCIHKRLNII